MGRTLKRVPLDFDWPTNEVWHGYIDQPDLPPCPDCKDTNGYTPEAYAIDQTFYPHQIGWGNDPRANVLAWGDKIGQKEVDNLVAEGRLWDFTRHEIGRAHV